MALEWKDEIEAEFLAKGGAIRAITPQQVETTMAPVSAFVLQIEECVMVLKAREVLNDRPISIPQIASLEALTQGIRNAEQAIRAAVPGIQAVLQELGA